MNMLARTYRYKLNLGEGVVSNSTFSPGITHVSVKRRNQPKLNLDELIQRAEQDADRSSQ